ncbi:carbamoyltransferase HypF [Sinosporangium siamense]|uniref:carbamoyltransferase HypF n=1 Tax=Sinosporangium siamense TaxID=1367973 RepID=UPI001950E9A3|nr:carbamoyltransferase HypF [Sinosporangium siamense]
MSTERVRLRIRVEGIVQGVGFRPHVYTLARRLDLAGWVGNDPKGVFIEVEGLRAALDLFLGDLKGEAPPLAVIDRVATTVLPLTGDRGFHIADSVQDGSRRTSVSPDFGTCDDCLAELFDPADRRYRYPFVNCVNCGPRFTIVTRVPYDRSTTTMARFPMCGECAREFADPADRRFHAQPTCCPDCGPVLSYTVVDGADRQVLAQGEAALQRAVTAVRTGLIVAVKGLGGYHLAVGAEDEPAVRRLRDLKHREAKPFAVMVADLAAARTLAGLTSEAERLLADPRRPIVLVPRHAEALTAPSVAPGTGEIGLMLPYTPLHHLLLRETGPIVLTSGNISDEPIAFKDAEALNGLSSVADAFLTHDRPIHIRTDDSVVRIVAGRATPLRRSRGYAPEPLALSLQRPVRRAVLACGGELKSTFCMVQGDRAFLSHHIGDLENYETLVAFTEGIEHFQRLFGVVPEVVAHDLHPEYLSTKYAAELADVELAGVQHHHAHIASCLADNRERGPVIGVAYDGLGYGTDGTLWGGELLIADFTGYVRVGSLTPVPLPGGEAAIRHPWRMAAAYLAEMDLTHTPPVQHRHAADWDRVRALLKTPAHSPPTTSAGRLFDAVAALLDLHDTVAYEGQAAIALEQTADPTETGAYPAHIARGDPPSCNGNLPYPGPSLLLNGGELVRAVVEDRRTGTPPEAVAARFHNGLAALTVAACLRVHEASGLTTVALSGGVFQNRLLTDRLTDALRRHGLQVLTHHRVPPNDGGLSLGQAVIAARRHP